MRSRVVPSGRPGYDGEVGGNDGPLTLTATDRHALLDRAWRLTVISVVWNVVEAAVAVVAGVIASSVALTGFGADSAIETTSAAIAAWRIWEERHVRSMRRAEELEHTASRITGALLLFLAGYLMIDGARRLLGFGDMARESSVGIALTAVSLVVMPVLGRSKLRTARALDSRAPRADAVETIACAWLSATTLLGLVTNAVWGWWWADPLAALGLVPWILREGIEAVRGECECGASAG